MGLYDLARTALPRGTREPEPAPWPTERTQWWGPGWPSLPWSSDGTADPAYVNSWGDAVSAGLAIPAAWRAMNLIAGTIAQQPLVAFEGNPPTQIDTTRQNLNQPWPVLSYFDWMFAAVCSVVLRGNFLGVKADFDESTGNPRQYIPVAWDDVQTEYDKGRLWYQIVGMDRELSWTEVMHVRGFMLPGQLTGIGVIEAHRIGLKNTRELMDYGSGAYSSGGVPPVVMRVDKPELSEAEAEYLQSRWVQRHSARDRRPAVVPKIVELEKVGLSMQDAEYLESRQFSIAEIAYMFNLNPEDLSVGFGGSRNRIEYQNIESRVRDLLIFSLQRWMSPIEQAFYNDMPAGSHARFNPSELFRADAKARMEMYEIALRNGIYTLAEVRAMERLPVEDYMLESGPPNQTQTIPFSAEQPAPNGNGNGHREEVPV